MLTVAGGSLIAGLAERYYPAMRQILLRVPDDVHARLTAQAAHDGRSLNALATEILDASVGRGRLGSLPNRRARLRARAASLGILRDEAASAVTSVDRERAIASAVGIGPVLDAYLEEDRDRR